MKKTIIVLACATSLFAQIPCRTSFNDIKNPYPRDAAADRSYAFVESRIRALENISEGNRNGPQYESELKSCELAIELFKLQLEKVDLSQKYVATQNEIARLKDSLIVSWSGDAKALGANLDRLSKESQRALAEKDFMLTKQKEEAARKIEALRSKTISVYKDARGTILSMSDILFEFGKADLKQELKENLAEVAAILKSLLTDANVVVEGHTDNVGSAASNKKLSEQRASAVQKYLVDRGVAKKRLKSVGYGQTKPVAENTTEEGKAKNRRVELVIKDK